MTCQLKANALPSLAAQIIRATRAKTIFAPAPALVPASFADALQIQAETVAALGATIGGWKVGFSPDGHPVSGPMLADDIKASGAGWPLSPAAPTLVEVEIAVRLARDLPHRPNEPYSRAEIIAAIAQVLPGIELICSRLQDGAASPFNAWLADRLGNAGYVFGAGRADIQGLDLAKLRCVLKVDGLVVHDRSGGHPQNDPLAPLLACANQPNHLRAGQIITTGSLIVPLPFAGAAWLEAEIEGLGTVVLKLAT